MEGMGCGGVGMGDWGLKVAWDGVEWSGVGIEWFLQIGDSAFRDEKTLGWGV